MNEALCGERHKTVNDRLDEHEGVLKEHSKDIGELKTSNAVHTTQIDTLCVKLSNFTTSIWALIIVMVGGFVTFYFSAVQTKIFGK